MDWKSGLPVMPINSSQPTSGSGAKLGPFKGRVFGVGPHLAYNTVLMHRPVILNFRNYQEFEAENWFEGNVTTFTTTVKF